MPADTRGPPVVGTAENATAEKWRVIRSALDSWSRTTRLCVIYLTINVPVDILIWLVKH
jgi:hypothetical protein